MSLALAELWTARLVGVGLLLQTIELLQIAPVCRDDGIWGFRLLAVELRSLPTPLCWLFGVLLRYRAFVALLWLRLGLSLLLFWGNSAVSLALLLTQIAVCVRFRGTFNGGSDYMSVLLLLTLSVAWAGAGTPWAVAAAFVYLSAQTLLSYAVAGAAKLRDPVWRNGSALATLARDRRYAVPLAARRVFQCPGLSRTLCWLLLAFECGFPLSLVSPALCKLLIVLGVAFHLANSVLFGLNRFLFAWAAAYPALLFTAELVALGRT